MGMTDLNLLASLPLTNALGINNLGQVAAIGPIPEPETYAMLLGGLESAGLYRTPTKGCLSSVGCQATTGQRHLLYRPGRPWSLIVSSVLRAISWEFAAVRIRYCLPDQIQANMS